MEKSRTVERRFERAVLARDHRREQPSVHAPVLYRLAAVGGRREYLHGLVKLGQTAVDVDDLVGHRVSRALARLEIFYLLLGRHGSVFLHGRVPVRIFYVLELFDRKNALFAEVRGELFRQRRERRFRKIGSVPVHLIDPAHEPEPRAVDLAREHVVDALIVKLYRMYRFVLHVQFGKVRARAQRFVEYRRRKLFIHLHIPPLDLSGARARSIA